MIWIIGMYMTISMDRRRKGVEAIVPELYAIIDGLVENGGCKVMLQPANDENTLANQDVLEEAGLMADFKYVGLLFSISGSIQVYEIPYIMLNGSNGTITPVIQIQQSAFSDNRVGFAAALSMMVFVIVVMAVGLQFLLSKKEDNVQ